MFFPDFHFSPPFDVSGLVFNFDELIKSITDGARRKCPLGAK